MNSIVHTIIPPFTDIPILSDQKFCHLGVPYYIPQLVHSFSYTMICLQICTQTIKYSGLLFMKSFLDYTYSFLFSVFCLQSCMYISSRRLMMLQPLFMISCAAPIWFSFAFLSPMYTWISVPVKVYKLIFCSVFLKLTGLIIFFCKFTNC